MRIQLSEANGLWVISGSTVDVVGALPWYFALDRIALQKQCPGVALDHQVHMSEGRQGTPADTSGAPHLCCSVWIMVMSELLGFVRGTTGQFHAQKVSDAEIFCYYITKILAWISGPQMCVCMCVRVCVDVVGGEFWGEFAVG